LKVFAKDVKCHIRHRARQAACAADGRAFIAEQRLRHVQAGGPLCRLCTQRLALAARKYINVQDDPETATGTRTENFVGLIPDMWFLR